MIGRQSLLVVANSVVGALLGYVALFAMARYLGAEVFGARQFALSAIFLVGVVTRLGFPVTHARRLARGDDVGASNGAYLALKLGLTGLFVLLAGAAAYVWFVLLQRDVTDTTPTALAIAAIVVVTQSVRDVAVNSFRGLRLIVEREAVLLTNTVTTVLLAVCVAVAYARSHGRWVPLPQAADWITDALGQGTPMAADRAVALLMGGYLAGDAAALALAIVLFAKARIPISAPRRSVIADYWKATLPLMALSVSAMVALRVNHLLVAFWWDARELGLYAAALKLNDVLMLLPNGITIALLPAVARLDRLGRKKELHSMMVETERWVSMLLWPAVVLVALHPRGIIHILLSDDFLAAAPVLVILSVQALVASLRIPLQTKALGLGHHTTAARVAVTALAVNLGLAVVLIPTHIGPFQLAGLGARGASLAALAAAVVTLLTYRARAKEWTGHPYFSKHLLLHVAAGAAAFAVCYVTLPWVGLTPTERFWQLGLAGLAVLAVYAGALAALGELRMAELRQVGRLVSGRAPPGAGPGDLA